MSDGNVGELMLISCDGLPGDDVSIGPDPDDNVEGILNKRKSVTEIKPEDLQQLYSALDNLNEANQILKTKLKGLLTKHKTDINQRETKQHTLLR